MLHLIVRLLPVPLHRLALRVAHAIRLVWWRTRRPLVVGCQVLAINAAGEVLLVRHSYGSRLWMLPGGGVARGEAPLAAGVRELAEETACRLVAPVAVTVLHQNADGTTGEQHIIAGRTTDVAHADGREIVEARWFAPEALPPGTSPRLIAHLAEWLAMFRASEQGELPAIVGVARH